MTGKQKTRNPEKKRFRKSASVEACPAITMTSQKERRWETTIFSFKILGMGGENQFLRHALSSLLARQQKLQIVIFSRKVQLLQSVNPKMKPREREYALLMVPIDYGI